MSTCDICKSPTPAEPSLGVTMCNDCYFGRSIDFSFAAQWADTRKTYAHRRQAQFRPSDELSLEAYKAFLADVMRRTNFGFGWRFTPGPDDGHRPIRPDDIA